MTFVKPSSSLGTTRDEPTGVLGNDGLGDVIEDFLFLDVAISQGGDAGACILICNQYTERSQMLLR
jgi:hypothetical protein